MVNRLSSFIIWMDLEEMGTPLVHVSQDCPQNYTGAERDFEANRCETMD
jgi:hypothetical protein